MNHIIQKSFKVPKAQRSWWARRKTQVKIIVLSLATLVATFSVTIWWFYQEPLLSPLSGSSTFRFLKGLYNPEKDKVVYGFLPYWELKDTQIHQELTHLGYFALTIGADGSIKLKEDGSSEPGFSRLSSDSFLDIANKVQENDAQIDLVLSQFNNDDIAQFLSSQNAQDNLIHELDSVLLAYPISGVNIDIEYSGDNPVSLQDDFTNFMKKLRTHLDERYDRIRLSVDMYASAAGRNLIWDVPALAEVSDYIVVMAYDFHRRSSPQAGPVAPLLGGREYWDSDINQRLKEFLEVVPRKKLLLGVPFYGYEWQTTNKEPQAHTFPNTGATMSFARAQELLKNKDNLKVEEHWNQDALSPYLTYTAGGKHYVAYYEDSRSLSYKLDYVNQLDLAGVAIWALGYEGDSRELWDVIGGKL